MADLQSAALAAGLLPRIFIKLDSYPLRRRCSWSLNNLTPDGYYIHQPSKITSSFIVLLSNAKFFSYEVLRIYLFVTIHLSKGFMPFTNKYSLCTLGCRLLYFLNGQNVTEATGATSVCQLIPIDGLEPSLSPV